jgi:DNA gyrase subunit A
MIISEQGKITRLDSSEIRECGRSTQGVRLIHLEGDDRVAAACLVKSEANGNGPTAQGSLIQ